MSENNFVSKLNLSTYRVVLWIIEIPNLKEFFLYVPWELSCFSFKMTNEANIMCSMDNISEGTANLAYKEAKILLLKSHCLKYYAS